MPSYACDYDRRSRPEEPKRMDRVRLNCGGWFNRASADSFEESTRWNGNNHISVNTGSQWDHEQLYKTAKGKWVLHSWSQWQGSTESWQVIGEHQAYAWLLNNEFAQHVPNRFLAETEV